MPLHHRAEDETPGETEIATARLYRDLVERGLVDADLDWEQRPAETGVAVSETLFEGDAVTFDPATVRNGLDALLPLLVALRSQNTHGQELIRDLARLFDVDLSPGTVYPKLHALDEAGVLRAHEFVQTTEYTIGDRDAARARIEAAMHQYVALGALCSRALNEL